MCPNGACIPSAIGIEIMLATQPPHLLAARIFWGWFFFSSGCCRCRLDCRKKKKKRSIGTQNFGQHLHDSLQGHTNIPKSNDLHTHTHKSLFKLEFVYVESMSMYLERKRSWSLHEIVSSASKSGQTKQSSPSPSYSDTVILLRSWIVCLTD